MFSMRLRKFFRLSVMWLFRTPYPPLPGLCGVYGGQDEGALLPGAPSTLSLLTYEDAMCAVE